MSESSDRVVYSRSAARSAVTILALLTQLADMRRLLLLRPLVSRHWLSTVSNEFQAASERSAEYALKLLLSDKWTHFRLASGAFLAPTLAYPQLLAVNRQPGVT